EDDKRAFARMALKPLSPEVLYDSIMVVTSANSRGVRVESRADFVKAFQPLSESGVPDSYPQGIPQILKLLNAPLLNSGAPVVDMLARSEKSRPEAIETLYLAALSRRPTEREVQLLSGYLERQSNLRDGHAGVLWMLLNSGEFALNH